jgi:hypothetical protein
MKLLARWGVTLGITGSVLLAGLLGMGNLPAMALPQEQVVKTLQEVPIFTLTNPKGEFVILSTQNQSKTISQIGFFISQQDAQKFLDNRLKKENPQLASSLQVRALSLADYYKLVLENKKKKDSDVLLTLVPVQQQVDSAKSLLGVSKEQPFNGVPLFVPRFKKDNSYLTIPISQGNNERYIPFYFEKEQATALLDAFKKAVPQEAANTEIQVVDLSGVIDALNTSNEPAMNKIFLFPSRESIEFIRSLVQKSPTANQPAAAPAKKK